MAVARTKRGGTIKTVTTHYPDGRTERHQSPLPPSVLRLPSSALRPPGLGDLVERLAKPIAALIDNLSTRFLPPDWETHLANCGACARRRTKLNLICPNIERCPVLEQLLNLLPKPARDTLIKALRHD